MYKRDDLTYDDFIRYLNSFTVDGEGETPLIDVKDKVRFNISDIDSDNFDVQSVSWFTVTINFECEKLCFWKYSCNT